MIDISDFSDLNKMVTPFWRTNVMYNEMTSFIVREDGSITAKLLFKPTKITSVKSNDLKTWTTYQKPIDGEIKEGVWTVEVDAAKFMKAKVGFKDPIK